MSGSDGPGGGSGGSAPWDDEDCSKLVINADLEAPSPGESFASGNTYDVDLIELDGVESIAVLAGVTPVGALRPHPSLIRCLRKGASFVATVTSSRGGDVKVRVSAP